MIGIFRVAALLSIISASAHTAEPPPNPPLEGSIGNPTFNSVLVHSLNAGRLRITLEATKLTELARRFPKAVIHHGGDAGDHQAWICLAAPTRYGLMQIRPSSGELEGGDRIDSVLLEPAGGSQRSDCPLISRSSPMPVFDGGLKLGISRTAVTRRLGTPSSADAATVHYDYAVPTKGRLGQDCSIGGSLTVTFENDHVARIWAIKVTSC